MAADRGLSRRGLLIAVLAGAAGVAGTRLSALAAPLAAPTVPSGQAARTVTLIGHADRAGHGSITVVDTDSNTPTGSIPLRTRPNAITTSPDGRTAFVATQFAPGLTVIDTRGNTISRVDAVGGFTNSIVFTPDGAHAYVASGSRAADGVTGGVAVVDTATGAVVARIAAGLLPHQLAITPDGRRVFVADERGSDISVVDTATNAVIGTVRTGRAPLRIAMDSKGSRLFVASFNSLASYDPTTFASTGNTVLAGYPGGLALGQSGALAFVSLYTGRKTPARLTVVNTAANRVLTQVDNGNARGQLAIAPRGDKVFVVNPVDAQVSVVDTATTTQITTLPSPAATTPTCVAVTQIT
ncbi:YncE family protein [Solihabitans fulvus]|uniref:YncE family protein n=1 Tax=Solihabitans fulvus TaxID=1892852 RepID=A0A5B2XBG2_9PSEU|nr:YncE family protein [Solihabitans fulvus]KAA2261058.1 YncE family protein [Solihabitans fulvus]